MSELNNQIFPTEGQRSARRVTALIQTQLRVELDNRDSEAQVAAARDNFSLLPVAARFDIVHSLSSVNTSLVRGLLSYVVRSDPSPLVRHEAAFAIGCVGGGNELAAVREALECDSSFLVRHEAAMAIAEIGGSSELPLLQKGMSDANEEVAVSCEVAIARILARATSE